MNDSVGFLSLNDGRAAPQLGLGVWQIPEAQVAGVVRDALQCGYRFIDTATIYRNERGVGLVSRRLEFRVSSCMSPQSYGTMLMAMTRR